MAISSSEKYYGAAIFRLIRELGESIPKGKFSLTSGSSNSAFILEGNTPKYLGKGKSASAGIFLKISNKRLSPWRYTFTRGHQDEIFKLKNKCGQVFLGFVCGDDGIACIDFDELKFILDDHHEEQEWVSVSRRVDQHYRIKGNDGEFSNTISKSNFPRKLIDYFAKELE